MRHLAHELRWAGAGEHFFKYDFTAKQLQLARSAARALARAVDHLPHVRAMQVLDARMAMLDPSSAFSFLLDEIRFGYLEEEWENLPHNDGGNWLYGVFIG